MDQAVTLRNLYVYTHAYLYAIAVSERRGQEFKGDEGGIYWKS